LKKYRHSLLNVVQATHQKNRGNTCAILRKARKFLQFEAVAGFEPSANGIGTVYSVAVSRLLVHSGGYLANWNRKLLSL
jgi:hypothetical protein